MTGRGMLALVLGVVGCTSAPRSDPGVGTVPAASDGATEAAAISNDGSSSIDEGGLDGTAAQEFDLGLDFSFSRNPNGPWRYGYSPGTALTVDQFVLDSFSVFGGAGALGFWHPNDAGGSYLPLSNPSDGGGGYYPYVAANQGAVTTIYQNAWAVRSHEVAMEASDAGQYGVVEFVVPQSGVYSIQAHFEGIHFQLSSTDVHVHVGDAELFAANIDGYGGDPWSHAVAGPSPAADYQGTMSLQAGEIISFAVGFGADGNNYNDTTGLFAHIALSPD